MRPITEKGPLDKAVESQYAIRQLQRRPSLDAILAVYRQTGTITVATGTNVTITFNDLHTRADDMFGLSAGGIPQIKKGGLFIVVGQIQSSTTGVYDHNIRYSTSGAFVLNQFMGAGLDTVIPNMAFGEVYQGHIFIFSTALDGISPADDSTLNFDYSHTSATSVVVSAEMLVLKMGSDLGASIA